jgi:hypothetical protein
MACATRASPMVRKLLRSVLTLAAFAFCAPCAAAATLPDEVSNVTDPVVETVTGATGAAGATPAEAPAPPAAPPPAPPVRVDIPADPPSLPADATTAASHAASVLPNAVPNASRDSLSTDVVEGASEEAAGTVAPASSGSSQQLPGSPATSDGDAPANSALPAADEAANPEPGPVGFTPAAWFVAHIWPAIALAGGDGLVVLAAVEPGVHGGSATAERGPSARAPGAPAELSAQPPALQPGPMTTRSGSTPVEAALSIGVKLALLSGIAALLAFLALTLRREFSSAPGTPGHRRWRAPRA